jgi:phospholipid transport system substrate-binding protein
MAHRSARALVGALGLTLAIVQPAGAETPTATLRAFFERANAALRAADPERGLEAPRAAVRALVNEAFDFREASALALGPVWRSRTPAQQDEFVRLFADLLERGYVATLGSKVSAAGGVAVAYRAESVDGESAIVSTTLRTRTGGELPVDYRMIRRDGRWAVRDVIVEGVSLTANYRAQFNRVLRDASYADLIARMREDSTDGPGLAPAGLRTEVRLAVAEPPAPRQRAATPEAVAPPLRVEPPAPAPAAPAPVTKPADTPALVTRPAAAVTLAALGERAVPRATYWVQVGAFRTVEAAMRAVERFRHQTVTVSSSALTNAAGQPTGALARVLVGPFANRADAAAKLGELLSRGYQVFIAETRD